MLTDEELRKWASTKWTNEENFGPFISEMARELLVLREQNRSLLKMHTYGDDAEQRFMARVKKTDGCWLWDGQGGQTRCYKECKNLVSEFFGGDQGKTTMWFATPNPLLGGIAPMDLVKMRRAEKLLGIIKEQLADNEMPQKQNPADTEVVLVAYEKE